MSSRALLLSRRDLLRRGGAAALVLTFGGLLEACAESSAGNGRVSPASFKPSAGAQIPSVDVRYAMWPYGDTTMGFVGIQKGFFRDVGINLKPAAGETRLVEQTPGELLSGQIDIASGNLSLVLQSFASQPEIRMIQLHDLFVGNYLLASPATHARTYEEFARAGQGFTQAASSVVDQVRGKRVALSTVGSNRIFFSTLIGLAGLTPDDFHLTVIDDNRMLELARAGEVDFAMPSGAAQNVVLMNEGYSRVFGVQQLINNLRPGDPRIETALSYAGIVGRAGYIQENPETILRFMSVYYRIVDEISRSPDGALRIILPHLNAAAGVELTLAECKTVYQLFYQLVSFEQSPECLLNRGSPIQVENMYVPQIEAAKKAGVIPANKQVTTQDMFVGTGLYEILVELKKRYDALKPSVATGSPLIAKAEEQYANRNYLDAYRLLKAAAA